MSSSSLYYILAGQVAFLATAELIHHTDPQRRQLNDGTEIPVIGLGTWKSPPTVVENAVRYAICEAGYRHIDTAPIYQNLDEVGRGLHQAMIECSVQRSELWVTSKIWMVDYEYDDVLAATDRILKELGLDYLDQLLLHWPIPYEKPPAECPPDCPEHLSGTDDRLRPRRADGNMAVSSYPLWMTWLAMERCKNEGKVRSIGVSNFQMAEIDSLNSSKSKIIPAVNQVEAHVFWNQAALRKSLHERGILLVAYSPLGNPAIYSNRLPGMKSDLVADLSEESGLTPSQVMLNYLISLGDVVLPKSVTPARILSNIDFELHLTDSQIHRLSAEAQQSRLANPKNRPNGTNVFDDEGFDGSGDMPRILFRPSAAYPTSAHDQEARDLINKADRDGDKKLNIEELLVMLEVEVSEETVERTRQEFHLVDFDKDGFLGKEELEALLALTQADLAAEAAEEL